MMHTDLGKPFVLLDGNQLNLFAFDFHDILSIKQDFSCRGMIQSNDRSTSR